MSGQLQNFSIETDSSVLLFFNNGRRERVPVSKLKSMVNADDYRRIQKALSLRADYVSRNISSWTKPLLIALTAVLLSFGAAKAAATIQQYIFPTTKSTRQPAAPATQPTTNQSVKSQPSPVSAPTTSASVQTPPAIIDSKSKINPPALVNTHQPAKKLLTPKNVPSNVNEILSTPTQIIDPTGPISDVVRPAGKLIKKLNPL